MEANPGELQVMQWLCHRRLGKSFLLVGMCIERAISQPGADVKYACATRRQVRDIVEPMIGLILSFAPQQIIVERRDGNLYIRLPHWPSHLKSRIMFVGLDYRQGDALRGQACDFAALDEARDIMVLEYVIKSVLAPQFVGRERPCLIMASTPPESMEHPFVTQYCEPGFRDGSTVTIPGSQNEDWSEQDERLVRKELGGPGDLAYDREIECKLVSDTSQMVIPEFNQCGCWTLFEEPVERPEWYIPYVSLDTGWKDHVGCLFAYIDFPRQKLVYIGEIFEQYLTLGKIAEKVHEKYEELFSERCRSRAHWIADCDNLELETLRGEHNCPFIAADNFKRQGDVDLAAYRTALMEGRIEIEAFSCPHTVRQHKFGVWNKQRTSFKRSSTMGHLDMIAASRVMFKMARWHEQPIPYGRHGLKDGEWRNPYVQTPKQQAGTRQALKNLLGSRFRNG